MPPTPFQRLFTDGRPALFAIFAGAVAMMVIVGMSLVPTLTLTFGSVGQFVVLMMLGACTGAALGVFPGFMIVGAALHVVEWHNGAPFNIGDEVVILSRKRPGVATRVYAVWAERHQVRVELGKAASVSCEDVFSYTEVCRTENGSGRK